MKFSNGTLLSRGTTHGFVLGRVTGGSAVAGLDEPTCGLGGTGTTCANAEPMPTAARRVIFERTGRTRGEANVVCIISIPDLLRSSKISHRLCG